LDYFFFFFGITFSTALLAFLAPDFAAPTTRLVTDFFLFAFLTTVCPLRLLLLFEVFLAAAFRAASATRSLAFHGGSAFLWSKRRGDSFGRDSGIAA
jgi:hypothetical protein